MLTRTLAAVFSLLLVPATAFGADQQFELNCVVKWKGGLVDERWVVPEPTKLRFRIDRQKATVHGQSGTAGTFSEDSATMRLSFKGRYYDTRLEVVTETGEMTYLVQSAISPSFRPEQTGTCEMPASSAKPEP